MSENVVFQNNVGRQECALVQSLQSFHESGHYSKKDDPSGGVVGQGRGTLGTMAR